MDHIYDPQFYDLIFGLTTVNNLESDLFQSMDEWMGDGWMGEGTDTGRPLENREENQEICFFLGKTKNIDFLGFFLLYFKEL